jgi:hypothetical protein
MGGNRSFANMRGQMLKTDSALRQHHIEMHLLGQTAQSMPAAVLEAQAGAGDEIAHRTRRERFTGLRCARDAC